MIFGLGNDVFNMIPKAQAAKEKNKLDLVKINNFSAIKDTVMKVKRQPREKEKIIVHLISDKRLISRICKEL